MRDEIVPKHLRPVDLATGLCIIHALIPWALFVFDHVAVPHRAYVGSTSRNAVIRFSQHYTLAVRLDGRAKEGQYELYKFWKRANFDPRAIALIGRCIWYQYMTYPILCKHDGNAPFT